MGPAPRRGRPPNPNKNVRIPKSTRRTIEQSRALAKHYAEATEPGSKKKLAEEYKITPSALRSACAKFKNRPRLEGESTKRAYHDKPTHAHQAYEEHLVTVVRNYLNMIFHQWLLCVIPYSTVFCAYCICSISSWHTLRSEPLCVLQPRIQIDQIEASGEVVEPIDVRIMMARMIKEGRIIPYEDLWESVEAQKIIMCRDEHDPIYVKPSSTGWFARCKKRHNLFFFFFFFFFHHVQSTPL